MSAAEHGRVYPVTAPAPGETDPRFTHGLLFEVADLLERRGYPSFRSESGLDLVDLQQALYRFLYGGAE